jgi:hypothetical protein
MGIRHTKRVTARELGLLGVLLHQNISDVVQQLNIGLVRIGLESRDESIGHGTGSLVGNGGVGTGIYALAGQERGRNWRDVEISTYDV